MPVKQKKTVQKKTVQKKRNSFGPKYWSEDKDSLDARKSLEARKGRLILDISKKQREMAYKQEEFANYIVKKQEEMAESITKKQEEMAESITKLNDNIRIIVNTNAINFNLITKNVKFKNNSKPKGFKIITMSDP
jgi:hypothetical protein